MAHSSIEMGRPLREWRCGDVYHVYQRGNDRRRVFFSRSLYLLYIQRMFLMAKRYSVRVHAFCLMPNHIHLILEPTRAGGLSGFMRDLQSWYSRMLHQPRHRDGHSWRAHFGCKRLSEGHYRTAVWYVEYNPVKAKLVKRAEDWDFSSARSHVVGKPVTLTGKRKARAALELYWDRWEREFPHTDWRAWLQSPAEEALRQRIQAVELVLGKDRKEGNAPGKHPYSFNYMPMPMALAAPTKTVQTIPSPDGS